MNIRESLSSELEVICRDNELDFKKTSQDVFEFISNEEIVAYCFTQGPLPSYPDSIFDLMILSSKAIYDYDRKQQGPLHHILPLRTIIEVAESFEKLGSEDYLSVQYKSSALGTGLVFQGKLTDQQSIRGFSSTVAKKMLESS